MLVFPEGDLTPDGKLQPFRAGIGLLAENLKLPIVPIRIDGAHGAPAGRAAPASIRRRAIVCGGGARNKTLMRELADRLPCPVVLAETFGWSSDAMEAQAFAYLAVRSLKKLPITFPMTTGVEKPMLGGILARARA